MSDEAFGCLCVGLIILFIIFWKESLIILGIGLVIIGIYNLIVYLNNKIESRPSVYKKSIKNIIESYPESLEKSILLWHYNCIFIPKEIDELRDKIDKIKKKLTKKNKPQLQIELTKMETLKSQIEAVWTSSAPIFDFDLSSKQDVSYQNLISKFSELKKCLKIWGDGSISIKLDNSEYIYTPFPIPIIRQGTSSIQFFPKFIIIIKHEWDIKLKEYSQVSLTMKRKRLETSNWVPSDAENIKYFWRYQRVDGGPDRRYKNNFRSTSYTVGDFSFKFIHILFSNAKKLDNFINAFNDYKTTLQDVHLPKTISSNSTPSLQLNSICISKDTNPILKEDIEFSNALSLLHKDFDLTKLLSSMKLIYILDDLKAFDTTKSYRLILKHLIQYKFFDKVHIDNIEYSENEINTFVSNNGLEHNEVIEVLNHIVKCVK